MDSSVSFEKDIVPIFRQFRDSMTWRLDLTSFEDVKANASTIYIVRSYGALGHSRACPLRLIRH